MELIVTDVTEMSAGTYCVGGWDKTTGRMVRPLPDTHNWSSELVQQHQVVVGCRLAVTPHGSPTGIFPHKTEDVPVQANAIQVSGPIFTDWLGKEAPELAADLNGGFADHLAWNSKWNGVHQGVHVLPNTQCRSLVALRIAKENLSFEQPFDSLKATLTDAAGMTYQLAVSSRVLKEAFRAGGLQGAKNALPNRKEFHVRVGLARPFGESPKCYAMLNGVL